MKTYTLSCLSVGHRPGLNVVFVCDSCSTGNDIKRINEALAVAQFSLVENYTLTKKFDQVSDLCSSLKVKMKFSRKPLQVEAKNLF